MNKKLILLEIIPIFFVGCSTKINFSDFRNKYTLRTNNPVNYNTVSEAALLKFKKQKYFHGTNFTPIAQSKLLEKLKINNFLRNIKLINNNQIKDYIKLSELDKVENNIKKKYFLIKSNLLNINIIEYGKYHPAIYNKKGKLIRKHYFSYKVCTQMNLTLYSLPDYNIKYTSLSNECNSKDLYSPNDNILITLINKSIQDNVDYFNKKLKKYFLPTGYVYEYKENKDHDLIAHISLGINDGIKQDTEINFYKIEKDKIGNINYFKVASGKVTQIVNSNDAWVLIKDKEKGFIPKTGYLIKPVINSSWFNF